MIGESKENIVKCLLLLLIYHFKFGFNKVVIPTEIVSHVVFQVVYLGSQWEQKSQQYHKVGRRGS